MHLDASCTIRKDRLMVEQILNSTNGNQYLLSEGFSDDYKYNSGLYTVPYKFFSDITKQILKKQEEYCRFVQINTLTTKRLTRAVDIIIEYDDEYYIARSLDFPLYAYGSDTYEAIQNIKDEIESVYFELLEDDNFSDEWINYKKLLNNIITD